MIWEYAIVHPPKTEPGSQEREIRWQSVLYNAGQRGWELVGIFDGAFILKRPEG